MRLVHHRLGLLMIAVLLLASCEQDSSKRPASAPTESAHPTPPTEPAPTPPSTQAAPPAPSAKPTPPPPEIVTCLPVAINHKLIPQPDRGKDAQVKEVEVKLPSARIFYHALHHADTGKVITEKYGDTRFSLEISGPWWNSSGWNWNLQDFLPITVQQDGRNFHLINTRVLQDAVMLENQKRAMVEWRWRLGDQPDSPGVSLTAIQLPDRPRWVFFRLRTDSSSVKLISIAPNGFPFITTGPPERERWVTTHHTSFQSTDKRPPHPLPDDDYAVVMHNRYAQERAGALLVFDPIQLQSTGVMGTYPVSVTLTAKPGQTEITFAVSCFIDQPTDEVTRVFLMEGAEQIATALGQIDWTPHVSFQAMDRLMQRTQQLIDTEADADAIERWNQLKPAYQQARDNQDPARMQILLNQVNALKEQILQQALKKYR